MQAGIGLAVDEPAGYLDLHLSHSLLSLLVSLAKSTGGRLSASLVDPVRFGLLSRGRSVYGLVPHFVLTLNPLHVLAVLHQTITVTTTRCSFGKCHALYSKAFEHDPQPALADAATRFPQGQAASLPKDEENYFQGSKGGGERSRRSSA